MNVSIFSLRPKGLLMRSAASLQETEEMCNREPIKMKKSMSERIRTGVGVFRNHSDGGFSNSTGESLVDPVCGSDDDFNKVQGPYQKKPKRRGKKNAKSRIGKLFRVKRSGKSRTIQNGEDSRDDQNTSSFEITSHMDSQEFSQEDVAESRMDNHDITQQDIAQWVREQRSIKANKDSVAFSSNTKSKRTTHSKKKEKKSKESLSYATETEKPPSLLVVDESIKISSTSMLSTPDFEVMPQDISDDIEDQSQVSTTKAFKPESQSSRSIKSRDSKLQSHTIKPSKPESQSSRSIKSKDSKLQELTVKPSKPPSQSSRSTKSRESKAQSHSIKPSKPESQSSRSIKSKDSKAQSPTAKPSTPHPEELQISRSMESQSSPLNRSATRRRPRNHRAKNELDVTDHTSTSVQDEDLHDSRTKTTNRQEEVLTAKHSPSSPYIAAAEDIVNPRRRYPSKKHLRKGTRQKHTAERKVRSTRIDFAGEVSASENAIPKSTDANIVSEINRLGSVVDIMMKWMAMYEKQTECLIQASLAEKDLTVTKLDPPTRNELPPQDWIRKLEEMQRGYRRQLTATKKQLKDLQQDQQAMRNRRIVKNYEERLKLRNTSLPSTRNNFAEKTVHPAVLRSQSNRPRSYQSISHRSASNRTRSSHSRSNHSGSNRSVLSTNKSIGEESSVCYVYIEDSNHTISTLSDRSVSFNPTVNVATTLSRHDMCPREKFSYWAGDGDEEITEEMLTYLSEKWKVRNLVHENEQELSSRVDTGGMGAPPFHLISDSIKGLLPPTKREGNLGYTYTIGIQD